MMTDREVSWVLGEVSCRIHASDRAVLLDSIRIAAWGDVRDFLGNYMSAEYVPCVVEYVERDPNVFSRLWGM